MTVEDVLRPLTESEVLELRDLYLDKYGSSDTHYLLMYNQIKWNGQLREMNASSTEGSDGKGPATDSWIAFRKVFYTHRDTDFRKYGTYISLHFDLIQSVSFHSWQLGSVDLFECLLQTKLIDWHSRPLLTNVEDELCESVRDLLVRHKGAKIQRARKCHLLTISHSNALRLIVPRLSDHLEVRPLSAANAELVHSLWTNNKEGSVEYIRKLIRINRTLGIFEKASNELIAWIFQNDFSGLGILQVLPKVQRRGYGQFLVAAMCKHIAEMEKVDLSAWIIIENNISRAVLEKVGLVKTAATEWIQL